MATLGKNLVCDLLRCEFVRESIRMHRILRSRAQRVQSTRGKGAVQIDHVVPEPLGLRSNNGVGWRVGILAARRFEPWKNQYGRCEAVLVSQLPEPAQAETNAADARFLSIPIRWMAIACLGMPAWQNAWVIR